MNLHEFQAKQLFAEQGVPVPEGRAVSSAEKAARAASELGGSRWIVKAQVHAGGRGKAGGVALVDSPEAASEAAGRMLGSRLVTKQTGEPGLPINQVLVEKTSEIDRELYLSALVDRQSRRVIFMGSVAGGMNIEEVAEETPEKIFTIKVDPVAGLQPYQCRRMAFALNLSGQQVGSWASSCRASTPCFSPRTLRWSRSTRWW